MHNHRYTFDRKASIVLIVYSRPWRHRKRDTKATDNRVYSDIIRCLCYHLDMNAFPPPRQQSTTSKKLCIPYQYPTMWPSIYSMNVPAVIDSSDPIPQFKRLYEYGTVSRSQACYSLQEPHQSTNRSKGLLMCSQFLDSTGSQNALNDQSHSRFVFVLQHTLLLSTSSAVLVYHQGNTPRCSSVPS